MADNVQPSALGGQQIRCVGLKSVGDQKKQRNLANKLPGQKEQKKKQNQEMNIQNSPPQTDEDTTPLERDGVDKDKLSENGSGTIIDLEI